MCVCLWENKTNHRFRTSQMLPQILFLFVFSKLFFIISSLFFLIWKKIKSSNQTSQLRGYLGKLKKKKIWFRKKSFQIISLVIRLNLWKQLLTKTKWLSRWDNTLTDYLKKKNHKYSEKWRDFYDFIFKI